MQRKRSSERGVTRHGLPRRRPRRPEEEFPFLSNTSSDFACDSVGEKSRSVQEHRFARCLGRRRGSLKSFGGMLPRAVLVTASGLRGKTPLVDGIMWTREVGKVGP